MKIAISLPDDVFMTAERLIKRRRVSRSQFYATVIRSFVEKERNQGITEQLNKVYAATKGIPDNACEKAAIADLGQEDWS